MKTLLRFFLISFVSVSVASAQCTIPNAGFENWTVDDDEPVLTDWFTIGGEPTTDAQSGSRAILLKNIDAEVFVFPGSAFGIFACNTRPAFLTGYIKTTSNTVDSVTVSVALYRTGQSGTGLGVGAQTNVAVRNNYTQFHVPITYGAAGNPDTAFISIVNTSLKLTTAPKFDNFAFSNTALGVPLGVNVSTKPKIWNSNALKLEVYPMPVNQQSTIRLTSALFGEAKLSLFDSRGREVKTWNAMQIRPGVKEIPMDGSGLKPGVYQLRLATNSGIVSKTISVQ
jgi:hypothetical protein